MYISPMSHLKVMINFIKFNSTLIVLKSIAQLEMDEDDILFSSNSINLTTGIISFRRSNGLMTSVCYHFFCCCIGLLMTMTLAISHCSSMMPSFIMIADSTEIKIANQGSCLIILTLKFVSLIDMAKISMKIIAYASQQQIKNVTSNANSYDLS